MIKNGTKKPYTGFASEFSQVMGAPLKDKTNMTSDNITTDRTRPACLAARWRIYIYISGPSLSGINSETGL